MASGRNFCCSSYDLRFKKLFHGSTIEVPTENTSNGRLKVRSLSEVSPISLIDCRNTLFYRKCNPARQKFVESAVVCASWLEETVNNVEKIEKYEIHSFKNEVNLLKESPLYNEKASLELALCFYNSEITGKKVILLLETDQNVNIKPPKKSKSTNYKSKSKDKYKSIAKVSKHERLCKKSKALKKNRIMNFVNIEVHESQLLLTHQLPSHPSKEPNPRKKTCLEKMPSNANPEIKRSQRKKLICKETSYPYSNYSNCSNLLKEARTKSNVWKKHVLILSFSLYKNERHRDGSIALHLNASNDVETNPGPGPDRNCDRGGHQQGKRTPIMVTSYNVRGLNDQAKLRHLVNHLYKTDKGKEVDFIACLQETYLTGPGLLNYLWRGNLFLTPGNGNSCGCITLLSSHLNVIASRNVQDRAHVIVCQKPGELKAAYIIANIYAPNPNINSKIEFFEQIFDIINEFEDTYDCMNSLVMGDFNLVFNPREVKYRNNNLQEKRIANAVKDLIKTNNLTDIWEKKSSFTWKRANADSFSTIDRILFSKANLKAQNVNVNWAISSSDHAAIEASFMHVDKPFKKRSRMVRIGLEPETS